MKDFFYRHQPPMHVRAALFAGAGAALAILCLALMGLWLGTNFAGNFMAGWLGSFWSGMDKAMFFLMIAGIALLAGAVILAFDRPLARVIKD